MITLMCRVINPHRECSSGDKRHTERAARNDLFTDETSHQIHNKTFLSEEPLPAEEEGARHTGMRHAETDTAFTLVDEILLIQGIHNIEPEQQLLPMPGQWND